MKVIFWLWVAMAGLVLGDGISMTKDHRFLRNRENCHTFKLTVDQIAELEAKRKGERPLYAKMKLTREQKVFLKEKTGKDISEVLVFENGWQDCSCCAHNIASRFEPDTLEVSNSYLVDDAKMREWERRMKEIDDKQAREKKEMEEIKKAKAEADAKAEAAKAKRAAEKE